MNVRRLAVAAAVALALLAPGAQAGGTSSLDGQRRTHLTFIGTLTEPAVNADVDQVRVGVDPDRSACTKASCDITSLRLVLPRGSSTGRFVVTVAAARELNVALYLYDADGEVVAQADVDSLSGYVPPCCGGALQTMYTRGFVKPRLPGGTYTLVLYNRGGVGNFTADVDFRAHPPDRPKKR